MTKCGILIIEFQPQNYSCAIKICMEGHELLSIFHSQSTMFSTEKPFQPIPELCVLSIRMGFTKGRLQNSHITPHTNHRRSSVRSHTLAPTSICDLSHSLCWSPLTNLGYISSVTYVCHPLWFICGHRKGILTSPPSRNMGRSG